MLISLTVANREQMQEIPTEKFSKIIHTIFRKKLWKNILNFKHL